MKKNRLIIVLMITLNINSFNNGLTVQQIEQYYASGQFFKEVQVVLDKAYVYLSSFNVQTNSIIIFDIDDTVISHWQYEVDCAYKNIDPKQYVHQYLLEARTPTIAQVHEFYDKIRTLRFKIIFLSARTEEYRKCTEQVLANTGYSNYEMLILKTKEDILMYKTASEFKQNKRQELIKLGYQIAACIGDQESDLLGNYTGLKVKLPNPLYCNA